jgi:serine/threonine protein kinase
MNKG